MGKKTYIYSLAHPITEEIRYVGKTNNLIQRLQVHLRDKAKTHKNNWIKSLLLNKMIPLIDVIDKLPHAKARGFRTNDAKQESNT